MGSTERGALAKEKIKPTEDIVTAEEENYLFGPLPFNLISAVR